MTSCILVIILMAGSRTKGVMRMLKNVGNTDRLIRAVIGIAAAVFALLVADGAWGIVLWVVAALGLGTAAFGVCVVYRLLGISTKK